MAADVEIKATNGLIAFTGKTPTNATLERKNDYIVTIKMVGYKENQIAIKKGMSGMSCAGNIFLCGGILGLIIDFTNGAIYNLAPNTINVTMVTARLQGTTEFYAVLSTRGDDDQIRRVVIPMIKI